MMRLGRIAEAERVATRRGVGSYRNRGRYQELWSLQPQRTEIYHTPFPSFYRDHRSPGLLSPFTRLGFWQYRLPFAQTRAHSLKPWKPAPIGHATLGDEVPFASRPQRRFP